jgi:putative RNA 2'-phosphotransferase
VKGGVRLSTTVSHALRHAPEQYGLALDEGGWADMESLLTALRSRRESWRTLTRADLERLAEADEKQRLQVADGRIRAVYGHSLTRTIEHKRASPPETLFHGTTERAAERILRDGLSPMGRQYVHLSADVETAWRVGRRRAAHPVVLEISARAAESAGVTFYRGENGIWLADAIPGEYVRRPGGKSRQG